MRRKSRPHLELCETRAPGRCRRHRAGTGIWTRTLAARGLIPSSPWNQRNARRDRDFARHRHCLAQGSPKPLGLAADSADLVSMASSLHWAISIKRATSHRSSARRRLRCLVESALLEANRLLVRNRGADHQVKLTSGASSLGRSGIRAATDSWSASRILRGCSTSKAGIPCTTPAQYIGVALGDDLKCNWSGLFRKFLDSQRSA